MEQLVYTNEKCVGCNKCISVCSSIGACVAKEPDANGRSIIEVDASRCVACGACFDACEHGAREYSDDTEEFFAALKKGEDISVLIAPSFRANYPEQYGSILGGLKDLGVKHFINVSFGADISTWGYVKYIQEYGLSGGISQPCPAVVDYIEKYEPRLIPKLFPVQSPLMCAATYARNELGIKDKFAFISPCIAKKIEITAPANKGLVSYNVTFAHLMRYVKEHDIHGAEISDEIPYGMGSVYPMPGGLGDYVCWLLGEDAFVRHIEGEKRMYTYLRSNAEKIANGKIPFLFIDALNCEKGCLCGTATDPVLSETDDALFNLLNIRESIKNDDEKSAWSRNASPENRLAALNEQFKDLKLEDYLRTYTDRSDTVVTLEPSEYELNIVFKSMHKDTEESRMIDCTSCGYDTCVQMAKAIYNGFNRKQNCVYYLKRELEEEQERQVEAGGVDAVVRRRARPDLAVDLRVARPQIVPRNVEVVPFVQDELALGEALVVADRPRPLDRRENVFGLVAVVVPRNEVRRDAGFAAGGEERAEVGIRADALGTRRPPGAERRAADLHGIAELVLQPLQARHEELSEERQPLLFAGRLVLHARLLGVALAAVAVGQAPHVVEAVGLVPDFPVLYSPLPPVGPAAVVVADRAGEDLRHLLEVIGDERVEMDVRARMLYRRPEAEEDFVADLFAGALQQVVRGAEHVVRRVLRVEARQGKDVVPVADALVRVDERPVVGARRLKAHRAYVRNGLGRTRAYLRAESRRMELRAELPRRGAEIGGHARAKRRGMHGCNSCNGNGSHCWFLLHS